MNNPGKAAIVTGGTFGLFAVGFAAIVSHPVVLAAALYSTYQVGKAAYDRNRNQTYQVSNSLRRTTKNSLCNPMH
jgi:hypothetical protein